DQVLANFRAQILIDLNRLKPNLGDLAFRLGHHSAQLTAFALQPRGVALERGQSRDRDQILLPETAHALQFLVNEVFFLLLGLSLSGIALALFLELRASFLELRFLATSRLSAQIEQFLLGSNRPIGLGIAFLCPLQKDPRKSNLVSAIALGLKP